MLSLPSEPAATSRTSSCLPALPPRLVRDAKKGRLIVAAPASVLAASIWPRVKALPVALWIITNGGAVGAPDGTNVLAAAEIEEETAPIPVGSVIGIDSSAALGTPRRPTRLHAWLEEILRRRTVLFLGSGPECDPILGAIRKLVPPKLRSRHCDAPADATEAFLDQLADAAGSVTQGAGRDITLKPPPPLPAAASRWGLRLTAVAAVLALASWLALYVSHGSARNWHWLQLAPGFMAALLVLAAVGPWLADLAGGRQLSLSECYARALARWSRWPRAPLAIALLILAALVARGLGWLYVPATFLVLDESAEVTSPSGAAGACRGEDPCTLIVPRYGQLRFDGADGSCSVDFEPMAGMIVIDLQSEDGCGAYDDEKQPKPRGG